VLSYVITNPPQIKRLYTLNWSIRKWHYRFGKRTCDGNFRLALEAIATWTTWKCLYIRSSSEACLWSWPACRPTHCVGVMKTSSTACDGVAYQAITCVVKSAFGNLRHSRDVT